MRDLTLVVLAAGMGSRYGGLKQIEPVGPHGEVLVEYSVFDALRAGFDRTVFVIKEEMAEAFRQRLGRRIERHCDTAYVFQALEDLPAGILVPPGRVKPWGTAHAVLCCRRAVGTPFAVINADDFYGRAAYQALAAFLWDRAGGQTEREYGLMGYRLADTLSAHGPVARGVCVTDGDGLLLDIHEHTRIEVHDGGARYTEDGVAWTALPLDTPVSMNMWGLAPDLFSDLEDLFVRFLERSHGDPLRAEFYLPVAIGDMVRAGRARVQVLSARGRWFGVTYQEDRPAVERAIRALHQTGDYPERLWEAGTAG